MPLRDWWQNRKRKKAERLRKTYDEILTRFLQIFEQLKQQFYELKDSISRNANKEEVFAIRNRCYDTYQRFLELLEELISIDKRYKIVETKIGFLFHRGMIYLFKYDENFDYDKALNTINLMENSLNNAESALNKIRLEAAA